MSAESTSNTIVNMWKDFGSLINSGLLVVSLIALPIGIGRYYTTLENSVEKAHADIERYARSNNEKWNVHLDYIKEQTIIAKEREGAILQRSSTMEREIRDHSRMIQELAYKTAASEQAIANITDLMKSIQQSQFEQSGETKVVREILQRLEDNMKRGK